MKFTLSAENLQEVLSYMDSDADIISSGATLETKAHISNSFGEVDFREIQLEIAHILIGEYQLNQGLIVHNTLYDGFIEMHFNFNNSIWMGESLASKIPIHGMQHNVFSFIDMKGFVDFTEGQAFKTLDIHLSLDYLQKWIGQSPLLDQLLKNYEQQVPSMLYPQSMYITPAMQDVISQIINCPFSGFTRKIYLESKVQELFSLQIELSDVVASQGLYPTKELSRKDVDHIHHAKKYIEENLDNPKNIEDLARICGTNQQKLKYGFKKMFGTTIFGYLQKCRMFHARDLLLQGVSVADVSFMVGYANHSSFSYAFREYYGCSPIKTQGMKQYNEKRNPAIDLSSTLN